MKFNKKKKQQKSILYYYWTEFKDRFLSSKRRVLKLCGVLMIPFIYAFVCIAAFWNPLANIGTIPMAIVSLDAPRLVAVDFSTSATNPTALVIAPSRCINKNGSIFPIPQDKDAWTDWYDSQKDHLEDWNLIADGVTSTTSINLADIGHFEYVSLSDVFMKSWRNGEIPNLTYQNNKYSLTLSKTKAFRNIDYITGDDAYSYANYNQTQHKWEVKKSKYFVEFNIPSILTTCFMNYVTSSVNKNDNPKQELEPLETQGINFFATYEKNYLTGEIVDNFSSFMSSIFSTNSTSIITGFVRGIFDELVTNSVATNSQKGYCWTYHGQQTISQNFQITNTLSYKTTESSATAYTGGAWNVTFEPNQSYIIRNDELKAGIENSGIDFWDKIPLDDQQAFLNASTYEGNTFAYPWNPSVPGSTLPNSFIRLMSAINQITLSIPQVKEILAEKLENDINKTIHKLFPNLEITISGDSINEILCNDQPLDGLFSQDSRFIKNDYVCKDIPIFGIGSLTLVNYPQLVGFLANPYDNSDPSKSIFHDLNIVSLLAFGDDESTIWNYAATSSIDPMSGYATNTNGAIAFNLQNELGSFIPNTIYDIKSVEALDSGQSTNTINILDYASVDVIGSQHAQYGIGIGQLFICVGLWVGGFSQTMVLDKRKRVKRISTKKWYLSKSLIMLSLSCVQSLILLLCLGLLGWFGLGTAFAYEWIFMMFAAMIFVIIIQSIWFSFRDRSVSMIIIIIFLVLNLASGWGTFPSFMQFEFFRYISYIMPFTYAIHAQGAIIYGIGSGVNILDNSLYILSMCGVLLIYVVVFGLNGLWHAKHREREMLYGSCQSPKVSKALQVLGLNQYLDDNKQVVWKSLPNQKMPLLIEKVRELFPYELKFKWFKKERHEIIVEDDEHFD